MNKPILYPYLTNKSIQATCCRLLWRRGDVCMLKLGHYFIVPLTEDALEVYVSPRTTSLEFDRGEVHLLGLLRSLTHKTCALELQKLIGHQVS